MYIGLNLSAAFDNICHQFFRDISRKYWFATRCVFLKVYLSIRSQQVIIHGSLSRDVEVRMGVLQGSVPGPLVVACYMLPLENELKD